MYKFFFIFVIFIILDLIYLNFSKSVYENAMKIKYENVKLMPAIISWACLIVSYYYIVEEPVEDKYLRGGILALGIYGVYNATNLAILNDYTEEEINYCITKGTFNNITTTYNMVNQRQKRYYLLQKIMHQLMIIFQLIKYPLIHFQEYQNRIDKDS